MHGSQNASACMLTMLSNVYAFDHEYNTECMHVFNVVQNFTHSNAQVVSLINSPAFFEVSHMLLGTFRFTERNFPRKIPD